MERTIRVTGKAVMHIKPDTTRLVLCAEETNSEYDKTLARSAEITEELRSIIAGLDFKREDLKTTFFNVDSEYEGYSDKNGVWKNRFKGYKFTHRMKLEFPVDNERLGRLLYTLGKCSVNAQLSIEYTVSDPERAKNELLSRAVADSKDKARVLSAAAGVNLGEIVSIDYSWGELELVSRPVERVMAMKCCDTAGNGSYDLDVEADDISISDTVTVVWQIS